MKSCENCKHWAKHQPSKHKQCTKITQETEPSHGESYNEILMAFISDPHEYYYTPLMTTKDFGCNLFEEE